MVIFSSTVGKHGDEETIVNYVKGQGTDGYVKLHESYQTGAVLTFNTSPLWGGVVY